MFCYKFVVSINYLFIYLQLLLLAHSKIYKKGATRPPLSLAIHWLDMVDEHSLKHCPFIHSFISPLVSFLVVLESLVSSICVLWVKPSCMFSHNSYGYWFTSQIISNFGVSNTVHFVLSFILRSYFYFRLFLLVQLLQLFVRAHDVHPDVRDLDVLGVINSDLFLFIPLLCW